MRCGRIAFAILVVVLGGRPYPAAADSGVAAGTTQVAAQHTTKKSAPVRRATQSNGNAVTHNRDSRDPNVGWHTVNGMRQCTQDCDNPEIPGSGYTCRNVNFLGMAMRECDSSSF